MWPVVNKSPWFSPWGGRSRRTQNRVSNSRQRGPLGQTVLGWSFSPVYHGLQNSISDPTHWCQSQSYLPKSDSGLTSHMASFFTAPEYKHTGLYALYEYVNDFDTCVVPLTFSGWWECTCMYQLDVCSFSQTKVNPHTRRQKHSGCDSCLSISYTH